MHEPYVHTLQVPVASSVQSMANSWHLPDHCASPGFMQQRFEGDLANMGGSPFSGPISWQVADEPSSFEAPKPSFEAPMPFHTPMHHSTGASSSISRHPAYSAQDEVPPPPTRFEAPRQSFETPMPFTAHLSSSTMDVSHRKQHAESAASTSLEDAVPPPPSLPPILDASFRSQPAPPLPPHDDCMLTPSSQEQPPSTAALRKDNESISSVILRMAGAISAPVLGSEQLPSIGSASHHLGGCRPCAFFHTRGCGNAEGCPFCHLCESGEKKRRLRDKRIARRASKYNEIISASQWQDM